MVKLIVLFGILLFGVYLLFIQNINWDNEFINEVPLIYSKNESNYEVKETKFFGALTLDTIFDKRENESKFDPNQTVTILATGDVIPARSVNFQSTTKNNFRWSFEKTAGVLRSADVTFINLEAPQINNCPLTNEGMIFCGNSKNIEGLLSAGVDIASLANNHAGNFGKDGITQTVNLLNQNGILATGSFDNNLAIKKIKGIRFAFLGFNDIEKNPAVSNTDDQKIQYDISEARKKADVVIVTFHWGVEYKAQPDERQIYLGHLAIDSGADLVIGNHPHWIQPIEVYNNKLITYAHGNFIFDQEWSEKTKEGVVGKYIFYKTNLVDVEFLPIKIVDYGQPYFLEGDEREKIIKNMWLESSILENELKNHSTL